MQQIRWFEREFDFTADASTFPSVVERLRGAPARLDEKCKPLSEQVLTARQNGTWSIKENIGHLSDLETLWQIRLDAIVAGMAELPPTDLQNRKTTEAAHNETPLADLLLAFRQIRGLTIAKLENIDDSVISKSALHPRLKIPMRTIDLFLFVADHDDHHLARITQLIKLFS